MADATTVSPEELASGEASSPHPLRSLAESLGRELHLQDFRSGQWFPKLVAAWLRHYDAQHPRVEWNEQACRPPMTGAIIQRASAEAALTGAGCGAISTGATMFVADSGPLGALVAVPVAGLAIGGEMILRSLIHLRMTCDLANAFDVRFRAEDPSDVSRLYALVFKTEQHQHGDSGQGLLERLVSSEAGDIGQALGTRLLGESVARNVVPFVGVAASSLTNWRRTQRLGEIALRYVRFRRALDDAFEAVRRQWEPYADLLIEGAWFLFTSDKPLNEEEAAVLVHLLRRAGPGVRERVMKRLTEDEGDFMHRLRTIPERARAPFLHALRVMSAADLAVPRAEGGFLIRVRQALKRPSGRRDLELLLRQFRATGLAAPFEEAGSMGEPAAAFEDRGLREEAPRGEA